MTSENFAKNIFEKVFTRDIERLHGMKEMWKSRKAPKPLFFDSIQADIDPKISVNDQEVWSLEGNFTVFKDSIERLCKRMEEERTTASGEPILSFDKDDVDTLDFVAASANLRSIIFGIDTKSKFDIKRVFTLLFRRRVLADYVPRNGWKYNPSNRYNERHDCGSLRTTSVQNYTAEN